MTPSTLPSHPWRLDGMGSVSRDVASAAQRLEAPRIDTTERPCVVCGRPHWRPDGDRRCVGCEMRGRR